MKIKCVMLITGQPVLYVDEGDNKMSEPAIVFLYTDEQKQQGVTFQHMLAFGNSGECEKIDKALILAEYEVGQGQMYDHFCNYATLQREKRSGIVNPNSAEGKTVLSMVKGGV